MKYLLMIYGNDDLWASFSPEVMQRAVADTEAFQAELKASGEWIAAYGVADQVNCKTITVKDGTLLVTDGPYIEAKEYLGSFDIIDCESLERALEIAAAVPFARIGSVELRPLMHESASNAVTDGGRVEDLLRPLAPQVLGSLVRRYGTFDECEDAVQEALLAAAQQWPLDGVPANPRGWLVTVADRRLTDELRRRGARRRREEADAVASAPLRPWVPDPADDDVTAERDDSLRLLFLCCHPALTPASQVALTLRAVGGLTTTEIAAAFLVPDATMAQRISRAKQRIRESGADLAMPEPHEREARLRSVLHVLYLVFNEGYAATSGDALARDDLTADAIRLARQLHDQLRDEPEVAGLLALMLLTEARRASADEPDRRTGPARRAGPVAAGTGR